MISSSFEVQETFLSSSLSSLMKPRYLRFFLTGSSCTKVTVSCVTTLTFYKCPYNLCECGGDRTPDLRLWRPLLYQLSYTPKNNREKTLPIKHYLIILDTVPAPIVLPPSRIAKRIPSSIATGTINFPVMRTLSPGITISVPAGSLTSPVTSVVLK